VAAKHQFRYAAIFEHLLSRGETYFNDGPTIATRISLIEQGVLPMGARKSARVVGPTWFKLEKYDKQKLLDQPGWLLQFGFRRDLLARIDDLVTRGMPLDDEVLIRMITCLRREPILQLETLNQQFSRAGVRAAFPSLHLLTDPQPRNYMGVHPTTIEELYRAQAHIFPEVREPSDKLFNYLQGVIEFKPGTGDFVEELDERLHMRKLAFLQEEETIREGGDIHFDSLLGDPVYRLSGALHQHSLFSVNLSLPDKLLIKQFLNSLDRARKYIAKAHTFSDRLRKNRPTDWIQRNLLAFIDLSIEKRLPGGLSLSKSEVGKLIVIFADPDESGNVKPYSKRKRAQSQIQHGNESGKKGAKPGEEQVIVDTVEPMAIEMMSDHSELFWALQAQVAEQLAKPNLDPAPPETLSSALLKPVTRRQRWKNK
jgi:hypothetical protein